MAPKASPRSLDRLVEHQMRRWEVEHRATVPPGGGAPCITVSRQIGSGGEEVAHRVAEWLDYGLFGTEIVDRIAQERHLQRELVAGLDEHVRDAIARYVTDSFHTRAFSESDYLRELVRVVTTLGERGMAVILGRGGAHILPARRALRVLVVAPFAVRVRRFAQQHEASSAEEARERLVQEDHLRRDFLKLQFGVEPDDPSLYDLTLNTEHLGDEAAARLVVEALRRRFPARRGTAGAGR